MFSKEYKWVNHVNKNSLVKIFDYKLELSSVVVTVSFPAIAINFSFIWNFNFNEYFFSGEESNTNTL